MDCFLFTILALSFWFYDDISYFIKRMADWMFDQKELPRSGDTSMSFGGTITDLQRTQEGDAWVRVRDKGGAYKTVILEDQGQRVSEGDSLWWQSKGHAFWTSYDRGAIEVELPIVVANNPERPK